MVELIPPYVQTDLMGGKEDPRAMPLDDFIREAVGLMGTDAEEILVERVKPLRTMRDRARRRL